ncbi:MAG: DUF2569 family protein [Elusimicrobia bacterium]|nr:DUF2569 family protein [Elusimicrobiota bacterium]
MPAPLNEFGGWLRFFQVANWIGVAVCGAMAALCALSTLGAETAGQVAEALVTTADLGVTAWLTCRLLRPIKDRSPRTPARVIRLIGWIAALTVLFAFLEAGAALWANGGQWTDADTRSMRGSFHALVWCGVWTSYFRRSRRVRAYYGLDRPAAEC